MLTKGKFDVKKKFQYIFCVILGRVGVNCFHKLVVMYAAVHYFVMIFVTKYGSDEFRFHEVVYMQRFTKNSGNLTFL